MTEPCHAFAAAFRARDPAGFLSACGSNPQTVNANPASVAIQYDDPDELQGAVVEKANAKCAKWGKVPEMTGISRNGDANIATFRCVTPGA